MAALASEMPPLHTAEALAGVQQTANSSSQPPPQNGAVSGGVGGSASGSGGVIDSSQTTDSDAGPTQSQASSGTSNNTISAAADSSDNQPSTPQPHLTNGGDPQQPPTTPHAHHPYANHHIYAAQHPTTTASSSSNMSQMYPHNIYSTSSNMDMQQQQQQQQQQQPQTPSQHSAYPSYLNTYEQFYQQQQQQQTPSQNSQMDYINSNSNSSMYSSTPADYKQHSAGVRYHPYLHAPTSGLPPTAGQNSNSNNALDAVNSQSAPVVSSASSSVMSPRVVSSTSPTSSSNHMQMSGSASSIGSMSAGNPSSPASGGGAPQCKKCGIMCTNEAELQEHITNVHGASPYGSSGYASSPYIKEELQQQTPPSQQQPSQQPAVAGGNPGEILDLDSQKMLYPPGQGVMPGMMHTSVGGVTDPLQSMHSMQQRAGIATWDQQQSEGLPPYMQSSNDTKNQMPNHSPYYQSPKLSPYHVSNSSNVIKSEYPIIKSEYQSDSQQYMGDKSFDPTAPVSQQMMPPAVSSSPSEFPSTTTGGPQDVQQNGNAQFRGANFEPPTSSSALTTNIGTKAANWKSNEARRPKTYNCTACNKWFTSSGHLKRHYNTTLHKNAVKSSGQPDPASLPISVHHHPAREGGSGKASRRGSAAAATAAANAAAQQQQQPPNPVQPPEPPNSPQDYGGSQTAAGGMTPMSHYAATPSPNSMYQQQQYPHNQYMPQVQSTTNASPQHASTMAGAQQPGSHHQQTVMNGHPNALAGLSVPTTRQQMPMPSSQMRGLLNTTTTTLIQKNNHLEAAMEDPVHLEQDLSEEDQMQRELELEQLQQQQRRQLLKEVYVKEELDHSLQSMDEDLVEMRDREAPAAHRAALPHMHPQHQLRYQLESHQADMERLYHNTTPSSTHSSMRVHSPHIISHQQYQEQLQLEQQQMQGQATYTLTPTPPPQQQQQLHHSIMEPQHYINMPLAINTQQHNSMLQLQPQLITTEQQQPLPDTTIPTTSMANMLPHNHLMQQQLPPTELQPLANTQQQQQQQQQPLATISTSTQHMPPSHITTSNITSIPSYHQLQQEGSVLQPLDHMLTYPHTIIGNSNSGPLPSINTLANTEIYTLDAYGNLIAASPQHLIQTADGQLVQLITTNSATGATTLYTQSYNSYIAQRSPQEGDLPPISHDYKQEQTMEPSMSYSPNITNSSTSSNSTETKELRASLTEDYINNNFHLTRQDVTLQQFDLDIKPQVQERVPPKAKTTTAPKRKRNVSTSSSVGANCTMLPSGRIKCLPCDKEFTKICYLTQHNKSFHSGEYPFRCQKCGKRYQSEDVYLTHLGKHKTVDKAHKCDLCPKQFHHKTDLRRHIEAIHTGNKQHSCDICEKSFCRKDHLRKHLETHNRPRVVAKKTKAATNRGATAAYAKLQAKVLKVENATVSPLKLEANQVGVVAEQYQQMMKLNEIKIEGNSTTSTPSPLMQQQMEDVAADDDEFLDEELDDYDAHEMDEDEYISIQKYEEKVLRQQNDHEQHQDQHQQHHHHHHQQQQQQQPVHLHFQQQLVKTEQDFVGMERQSYQIIEQEIPLY